MIWWTRGSQEENTSVLWVAENSPLDSTTFLAVGNGAELNSMSGTCLDLSSPAAEGEQFPVWKDRL